MFSDYIFLIIFTVEMCLKIVAMGFALRPYSYLRDTWNIVNIKLHLYLYSLTLWW